MSEDKNLELEKQIGDNEIAPSVAGEKDETPAGFWRRYKEPKWYVVHTYSGYENKVKTNLEKLVENRNMQDLVLQIIVPTETVVEHKESGNRTREKKIFPGYVLVKVAVEAEDNEYVMSDDAWYVIRNTRGVTGFVGPESKPVPLTEQEVANLGVEDEEAEE